MSDAESDFEITLVGIMLDLDQDDDAFEDDEVYRASFGIERNGNRFVASVWFPKDACPTVDLVRYGMSRLHLVLAQVARQTEGWRLDQTTAS